jgi:PAS domain S-box-containing protein
LPAAARLVSIADAMAATDWATSPIGRPDSWPRGLTTLLNTILPTSAQIVLFWGDEFVALYNDAYAPTIGRKHPHAFGRPARENWAELWDDLEPLLSEVRETGKTFSARDRPFYIERSGSGETVYFDVSYSAARAHDGSFGGVLCIVSETTDRVLAEQRLRTSEEQARGQAEQLAAINQVNTALAAELDLERLVQMVTDAGRELTGATTGAYFHNVMDETGERLCLFTLSGGDRDRFQQLGRPRATAVLGPIFKNVVIRSSDITQDARYGLSTPHCGMPAGHPVVRSYLAVPVVSRAGDVLGGLLFGHPEPGRFTDRHEALILGLAAQAAVGIQNARLLADVQTANETLERRVAERTAERDRIWQLSRDLLVVVDKNGLLKSTSPSWAEIFGWTTSEMVGRSYQELIHPEDIGITEAALAAARAGEHVPLFENRYIARDGSVRWISWLTSVDGELVYGSGRDITEARAKDEALRAAEAALRQSQKMEAMGQLTGGVAHDFNNLLTPILGSLDLLRRKDMAEERSSRLLDAAVQSAERAKTLVQRLLAFARRQPLQPDAVDVSALVQDIFALLSSTLGPQIQLRIDGKQGIPPAHADRNQLEMALLNLCVNARDAMPNGGELCVSVGHRTTSEREQRIPPGHYVTLTVTDHGTGMDDETLGRSIEPFFSTKGVGRGTGLGLSMVHGLARQLGGALFLESQLGLGTTAELWLPVSDETVRRTSASVIEIEAKGAGKVLLVDDDEPVRAATCQMLQDLGYEVIEADGADAALELVTRGLKPDLLVSDHLMPGLTGTELAREVRLALPSVGVLIISGYAEVESLSPELAHLSKPFRQADLVAALMGNKVHSVVPAPSAVMNISVIR